MALIKHFTLTTISLMGCLWANAQIADTTDEETLLPDTLARHFHVRTLDPVTVHMLRIDNKSPFAKKDISAAEIEKQNLGQDIPFLLQQTPSTLVTSDAGTGIGYTGLRIRGTDGTRINVTLNGFPVNDAESQGTFFVDLPDLASSTSSIQIQRGVGASTNGAGAFGATINVSNMEQASVAGGSVNIAAGSFNTQKYTLQAATGMLESGWQFDTRLSKISSLGYVQRSASDLKSLQFIAGWTSTDNRTRFRFQLLSGSEKTGQAWNGVPQDSLHTNRRYNELGKKPDGTYYNDQTDNYIQTYYQASVDHNFNKKWSLRAGLFLTRGKGYYQEYKMEESLSAYGLPDFTTPSGDTFKSADMIRQLWLDNYYYGGIYSINYKTSQSQVTLGGAVTQYLGNHYGFVKWAQYGVPDDHRWYKLDAQKNDVNVYLKAQHAFNEKLLVYGDLQYRNVSYFMNGFRKNPALRPNADFSFFNPKAGITYFLKDKNYNRQRLYASVAMANKEPNRDDFEASPNALPKAEQLTDIEAGYEVSRKKWSAAVNAYYMLYKDQLVLTGQINDVGAYTRTNVASSYRAGIELEGGVQLRDWIKVTANTTLSQNKIADFTEYMDDWDNGNQQTIQHSNTDIAVSPSIIGAFDIRFTPFQKRLYGQTLEIDLLGKHVGKQYLDNTGNEQRSLADYSLLDLRVRYVFKTHPFKEIALTLAVNNIFNRMYESNGYNYSYLYEGRVNTSNYYYPMAGTNILAGIGIKF